MNKLIYYPGFEVRERDWLKFALLYIDELNPIIPASGDNYLSDLYHKLMDETDLISSHRPDHGEGLKATLDAIDVVERILIRPESYSSVFAGSDVVSAWRDPQNHCYVLFEEKYTRDWERFCVSHGLGTLTDEGITLPKELGFIYMTLLAQTIADSRGISPITDYADLDRFSIFTRRTDAVQPERLEIAQAVIELKLPARLSQIELDEFIKLRNRPGFKQRLKAFHKEFDRYFDNIEDGASPGQFVSSFNSVWMEFSNEFLSAGLNATSFGLGVWILLKAPQIATEAYLKEVVVAGGSLALGGIVGFGNAWKNTRTRRYSSVVLQPK
jgi:hypothetical protein